MLQSRRDFLRTGAVTAGALAFGPAFWRQALAAPARPGAGPYGPLQAPDLNGIALPRGFSSRLVAQGGQVVPATSHTWHAFSDGAATFATPDGGWILVSNSEAPPQTGGGASAIRFRRDGGVDSAYRILGDTNLNCAGGPTPWGTWLSCEEFARGRVWECDPTGVRAPVAHDAMGVFEHEAVCVDPVGRRVYLSEDDGRGGFYRFTPERYPALSRGLLEIAVVRPDGVVDWARLPDPRAESRPTRIQVPNSTVFRRGEGVWFDSGIVYLATTGDERIWAYNTGTETIEVLYDARAFRNPPLTEVDNVTVSRSGDLFVCEDNGDLSMGVITPERQVANFLQLVGSQHSGAGGDLSSELAGVVFDPSGTRMYFASQRAFGSGAIYEITGPFRQSRPRERTPPGLRVDAESTLRITSFLNRGLPVTVRLGRAARVNAKLTALTFPSPRDARGRVIRGRPPRSRRITLASQDRPGAVLGRNAFRLRARGSMRTYLRNRRRPVSAALMVAAVDSAGNRATVTRKVKLSR
jgi:secreted PhoX family phosphatase